jgi:hypothetical protein
MDRSGILLYGYGEESALLLHKALSEGLGHSIVLYSASGMEERTLLETISAANKTFFEEKDPALLIFMGFGDDEIRKTIEIFPAGRVKRPIFCSLTKENINWPVKSLVSHLQEEDRYWKNKGKNKG